MLRHVAEEMPTTLVTFFDESGEAAISALERRFDGRVEVVAVPAPKPYEWWRLLLGLFSSLPIYFWSNRSRGFTEAVRRICEMRRPTVGLAVCTFMYPYLEDRGEIPLRIVDTHNIDSDLMARYLPYTRGRLKRSYGRITVKKLDFLERKVFEDANRVWVCSREEMQLLEKRSLGRSVVVVPNGVDTDYFMAGKVEVHRGRLLFFGKLNYFPNVDALTFLVDDILPRLEAMGVPFHVKVVGAGAADQAREICGRSASVDLVGRVEDIRPWLAGSELVVVPLRMGSGTRLKILEAMAAGRPVLSTPVGAEGIVADRGSEILEADTAETFAEGIASVLQSPSIGDEIGRRGREAVRRRYDWRVIGEVLKKELRGAKSKPGPELETP